MLRGGKAAGGTTPRAAPRDRGATQHRGDVRIRRGHAEKIHHAPKHARGLKAQAGRLVPAAKERVPPAAATTRVAPQRARRVVVIGAGPCGLFAALTLASASAALAAAVCRAAVGTRPPRSAHIPDAASSVAAVATRSVHTARAAKRRRKK